MGLNKKVTNVYEEKSFIKPSFSPVLDIHKSSSPQIRPGLMQSSTVCQRGQAAVYPQSETQKINIYTILHVCTEVISLTLTFTIVGCSHMLKRPMVVTALLSTDCYITDILVGL